MSKRAEERALEAYPVIDGWEGNQYGEWGDLNLESRKRFREGYEQAEKDIKEENVVIKKDFFDHLKQSWYKEGEINGRYSLTWEDIKRIVEIADSMLVPDTRDCIDCWDSEQAYYEEVLKKYNDGE